MRKPVKDCGRFLLRFTLCFGLTGVLAVLAFGLFTIQAEAQTPTSKTLRLASTPWSPFTNAPGKARFALELVHAALERAGITENTTIVEDGKLTAALLKGEYDGSAALWKDAERERTLLFSQPYLENRLILVGRKGSDVSATKLSALKGKRIALVETYAYGDTISDSSGPIYIPSAGEEDSIQKVLSNEVAYTLIDELVVEYILKNYPDQSKNFLAFGSTPLLVRTLHFAVRKDLPDAALIIDKFNSQLRGLIADRTYNRLLQLDWIQADVNGDGQLVNIPRTDQAGIIPPDHSYNLVTPPSTPSDSTKPTGFFVGGKVYPNWTNVPDTFKLAGPNDTVSGGTKFSIFSFKF
jgi:polar amino acid transport system substrate-binding protein